MKKLYAKIIEDNGGGLQLYIMDESDSCIYAHYGYEHCPGALRKDIQALIDGDSTEDWEGCEEGTAEEWKKLDIYAPGREIVASVSNGKLTLYPERMGAAAQAEFDIEKE